MIRNFIKIFSKIVNWKIVLGFLLLFFVCLLMPIKLIPDYFQLGMLSNKKDVLFRLLTTTIGFSGILLTVLLVAYNFYIKTTRRYTLEFVTDNNWLNIIFSGFFGLILFLSFSFFAVDTQRSWNDLNILYISYLLTFSFIILLFPLAILSLNESVSLEKVRKILKRISFSEMVVVFSASTDDNYRFDDMEKNPIILLKDISLNAIGDKDWMLPQTVLYELYHMLILSVNDKTPPNESRVKIFIWTFFCNHLKKVIVKQEDLITAKVLLNLNISTHYHFAKNKVFILRETGSDDFLKDYFRLIMKENVFFEIQSYFARITTEIFIGYFKNLHYTDNELTTFEYINSLEVKSDLKVDLKDPLYSYWFYLTRLLPDIIFNPFENAIDLKRKNVYELFFDNIQSLTDAIFNTTNLTLFQKREVLKNFLEAADRSVRYAIDQGVYENIGAVSHLQLCDWLPKDKYLGLRAFYDFIRVLKILWKKNVLSEFYISELFVTGRILSKSVVDKDVLIEVVDTILTFAQSVLNKESIDTDKRNFILYQLDWFQVDYLQKIEALSELKEKHEDFLSKSLEDFNLKEYLNL